MQWRYTRQLIAELRPGWDMAYIDALHNHEVRDIFAIQAARIKAKAEKENP